MNTELISVVVPIYNAQATLSRCIESVLRQTYPHFQLVLVNDGSTDESLAIANKYAFCHPQIKVISLENGGVSNARNQGMVNSDGRYVTFVDSDDYINQDYLETLHHNNQSDAFLVAGYTLITSKETKDILYGQDSSQILPLNAFFDVYLAGLMGSPWNKIYDLQTIKEHQLYFNRSISLGEDLLFNLDYIKTKHIKKLKIVNHPILNYDHVDSGTLSTSFAKKSVETLIMLFKEMISFMENVCQDETQTTFMKERLGYDLLFYFEKLYQTSLNKNEINAFVKETLRSNTVLPMKDVSRKVKNKKLLIKLWIAYYLGFNVYYQLFVKGE